MKDSDRYLKIVAWSQEDGCYVGRVPGLFFGGCHGDDEKAVYAELCDIVDEVIETEMADGDPLPPPTTLEDLRKFLADHERANAITAVAAE
jgi:predicted RNase H-like HicB family nuclease